MLAPNVVAVVIVATALEELLYFFGWIYFSVKKKCQKKMTRKW